VPGLHLFAAPERVARLVRAWSLPGSPSHAGAYEALRIEAGTPVFGIDMTTDTIPSRPASRTAPSA
jgi:glycine cleavage system aminomethyltransferase T